jgi:pimeloyl-ACP methyl ester carboxylesterase
MHTRIPAPWTVIIGLALLSMAATVTFGQLPALGASGLLHPARHHVDRKAPEGCEDASFAGAGIRLKGWQCRTSEARQGTLVYLHGVADNRTSAIGMIKRFEPRGFDVVAYDSRAHGESEGDACTYGFFEKEDLRLVLDTLPQGPIVLLGTSLGAAVALQEAAQDRRVTTVVAAETFSDLRTVATERAPRFFTPRIVERAFTRAERDGHFQVDAVSPVAAATQIRAPVLLIHGADDVDTRPDHARRVFAALNGPKRLLLVPGARHNESLRADVWTEVETWIDAVLERRNAHDRAELITRIVSLDRPTR